MLVPAANSGLEGAQAVPGLSWWFGLLPSLHKEGQLEGSLPPSFPFFLSLPGWNSLDL